MDGELGLSGVGHRSAASEAGSGSSSMAAGASASGAWNSPEQIALDIVESFLGSTASRAVAAAAVTTFAYLMRKCAARCCRGGARMATATKRAWRRRRIQPTRSQLALAVSDALGAGTVIITVSGGAEANATAMGPSAAPSAPSAEAAKDDEDFHDAVDGSGEPTRMV